MRKATTITSREFHQDTARVTRAARKGPVYITKHGKPDLIVLEVDEFEKERRKPMMLNEIRGIEGLEDIELEIPPRTVWAFRDPFEND